MIHLETVSNRGRAITSGISALSQLFVVVFAITMSLALTVMALAQQSTNHAAWEQPQLFSEELRVAFRSEGR